MKNRILTVVLLATTLFTLGQKKGMIIYPESNIANAGIEKIAPTIQTIDDSSPLITYSGNWSTTPDNRLFGSTQHYSEQIGATATFQFTGDFLEIIYCSEPKAGVMGVIIDGKWLPSFNLKSATTNFKAIAHYEELGEGKHEVIFVNLQSGRPVGIDFIKIR